MGTNSTAESGDVATVGVLFVHGIGEQQEGDTLTGLGEPVAL